MTTRLLSSRVSVSEEMKVSWVIGLCRVMCDTKFSPE